MIRELNISPVIFSHACLSEQMIEMSPSPTAT